MQFIQFFKNVAITGGFLQSWRSARGGTASTRGVLSGESDVAGAVASRRVRYQAVSLGISTLT